MRLIQSLAPLAAAAVLAAGAGGILSSCALPASSDSTGSLAVTADLPGLDSASTTLSKSISRTALPDGLDLSSIVYDLSLAGPKSYSQQSGTGSFATITGMPTGSYTASVTATASSVVVGTWSSAVTIQASGTTSVTANLEPPSGTGNLALNWSWSGFSAIPSVALVGLRPAGSDIASSFSPAIPASATASGSIASTASGIPAGIYRLSLSLKGASSGVVNWGVNTVVLVLPGIKTTASYALGDSIFKDQYVSPPTVKATWSCQNGNYAAYVSWFDAAGAVYFDVYRCSGASAGSLGSYSAVASNLSAACYGYVDTSVVNSTYYKYRIVAKKSMGGTAYDATSESDVVHVESGSPTVGLGGGFLAWPSGSITLSPAAVSASSDEVTVASTITPDSGNYYWYVNGSLAATTTVNSATVGQLFNYLRGTYSVTVALSSSGVLYSSSPLSVSYGMTALSQRWSTSLSTSAHGSGWTIEGSCAALSNDGAAVYVQAMYSGDSTITGGAVFALDAATGTQKWYYETGPAAFTAGSTNISPTVGLEGSIYAGGNAKFYRLDQGGAPLWASVALSGPVVSTAALGSGRVYVRAGGTLYAIDCSVGTTIGQRTISGTTAPVIAKDGTVLVTSGSAGILYDYSSDLSSQIWTYSIGAATDWDGALAITSSGSIICSVSSNVPTQLSASGALEWSAAAMAIYLRPVIDSSGNIFFGSNDGFLRRLDASGGSLASSSTNVSYCWPALAADGTICCANTASSTLDILNPSLIIQSWLGGSFKSSPCVGADGTVYIGDTSGALHAYWGTGSPLANNAPWPMVDRNPQHTNDGRY
jgi:FOG: WD40-like repeat